MAFRPLLTGILSSAAGGVPWDISGAEFVQSFSVSSQETSPQGLFFKPDGTKMYVIGSTNDNVNEYDLSAAWDISTASYSQNLDISSREINPFSVFFKSDGTKMYFVGVAGGDINEYSLSTAWDVSTGSYTRRLDVTSQESTPLGVFFKADGTKMYVVGLNGNAVFEYDLSTAWDISSATYLQSFSILVGTPTDIFFKPDGAKMYIVGSLNDAVNEYDLSTAWDVTTASSVQSFTVAGKETEPYGLFFGDDGKKMYVTGGSSDAVHQYNLT